MERPFLEPYPGLSSSAPASLPCPPNLVSFKVIILQDTSIKYSRIIFLPLSLSRSVPPQGSILALFTTLYWNYLYCLSLTSREKTHDCLEGRWNFKSWARLNLPITTSNSHKLTLFIIKWINTTIKSHPSGKLSCFNYFVLTGFLKSSFRFTGKKKYNYFLIPQTKIKLFISKKLPPWWCCQLVLTHFHI